MFVPLLSDVSESKKDHVELTKLLRLLLLGHRANSEIGTVDIVWFSVVDDDTLLFTKNVHLSKTQTKVFL